MRVEIRVYLIYSLENTIRDTDKKYHTVVKDNNTAIKAERSVIGISFVGLLIFIDGCIIPPKKVEGCLLLVVGCCGLYNIV